MVEEHMEPHLQAAMIRDRLNQFELPNIEKMKNENSILREGRQGAPASDNNLPLRQGGNGIGVQNHSPAPQTRAAAAILNEEYQAEKQVREKFVKYLTLLFHDLCAKTNGLTKKEIDEYTFLKVRNPLHTSLLVKKVL
jgi:hypothetical protein